MCGRITLATDAEEIAAYFQLAEWPPLVARYNIAPTQQVAVIRSSPAQNHRELAMLRWGLIPSWAEDLSIGSRLINARAETLTSKPAFRDAFKTRRCLVIADGFYEWKGTKIRQPYWIRVRDSKLFGMAGLWERKENPPDQPIESFTIITTDANELIRPMHDRMPAILPPEKYAAWLDPATRDAEQLKPLLCPYPAERMTATPVGCFVNDPQNEGEKCIEAAAEAAEAPKSRRRKGEDPNQGMLF